MLGLYPSFRTISAAAATSPTRPSPVAARAGDWGGGRLERDCLARDGNRLSDFAFNAVFGHPTPAGSMKSWVFTPSAGPRGFSQQKRRLRGYLPVRINYKPSGGRTYTDANKREINAARPYFDGPRNFALAIMTARVICSPCRIFPSYAFFGAHPDRVGGDPNIFRAVGH